MSENHLGPYVLEEMLGSGAMGEVHRALDTRHGRRVALKCLPARLAHDVRFRARFRTEANAVAALRHPHVVPIHEVGMIDDRPFIAMQLIDGVDLRSELRRRGPLEPDRAVSIVAQLASALDAAHIAGIVHRDVKPSNVLLDATGTTAYLIDFGLARHTADTRVTESGVAVGTLAYMAPERFDDAGDHRVDVYALACLLFELLTGDLPFPVIDLPSLMYAHVSSPPPRPSITRRGVPTALDAVVAGGMRKDPDRRFQRAGDLARAARAALAGYRSLPVASTAHAAPRALGLPRHAPPAPALARTGRSAVGRAVRLVSFGALVVLGGLTAGLAAGGLVLDEIDYPVAVNLPDGPRAAVIDEVAVGASPRNIAVTGDGQHLYATNREDDTVSVVDTGDGRVLRTLAVGTGTGPEGIAVAPGGATAYVVNNGKDTVGVLDTASGRIDQTIPVDGFPTDIAVAPDGRTAFVTAQTTGQVLAIDTATSALRTLVATGGRPQSLTVSHDGRTVLVTDGGLDALLLVDAASGAVTAQVPVGPGPDGVALSPDGRTAYVVNIGGDSLSVVDLSGAVVRATIPVGSRPIAVAIHPDGHSAYVTNNDSGTISVIDTATDVVIDSLAVGSLPEAVAVAPDGKRIYAVNAGDGTLSVIDTDA